jgi:hypothetical protein
MKLILEVLEELFGMFVSDAALTLAVLALVGVVLALAWSGLASPAALGVLLVVGAVAVLLGAVWRAARKA